MPDTGGNIADTLRFLGRGSLMALATAMVCGFAAYVMTFNQPDTFTATSTVYAATQARNVGGLGLASYTSVPLDADAYGFAATSRDVLTDALQRLGASPNGAEAVASLGNRVHISTDETATATFVHISAQSATPKGAADIANAVAAALISWDGRRSRSDLDQLATTLQGQIDSLKNADASLQGKTGAEATQTLAQNISLRIQRENDLRLVQVLRLQNTSSLAAFENASPPLSPSGPRIVLNTVLAFVLGLIVGYLVVGVYEALRLDRRGASLTATRRIR